MPTLIWRGGGVLDEGGRLVPDGGEFSVSDERAAELLTRSDVEEAETAQASLAAKTRAELNEIAQAAGVEAAESLPNKDAVIEAINESEAQPGAGQTEGPVTGSQENPDDTKEA